MTDKTPKAPMTPEAAQRIQSNADKTGNNQDFKSRAQSAAATNSTPTPPAPTGTSNGGK